MPRITYGNTTFDPGNGTVSTAENTVKIRGHQAALILDYMLSHPGVTVTHDTLLNIIWNYRPSGPEQTAIRVLVHAIREALAAVSSEWQLSNVPWRGYRLDVPCDTVHTVTYTNEQYKALHRALKIVAQKDPLLAAMIRGE